MSDDEDWRDRAVPVAALLVLGVGFVGMFLSIEWFWMVWVLGFAVVVPMLAVLLGVDDEEEPTSGPAGKTTRDAGDASEYRGTDETGADALETLRERYARGDLTDAQFERKLERLLETETVEDLEDAGRGLDETTAPDVEFGGRTDRDASESRER